MTGHHDHSNPGADIAPDHFDPSSDTLSPLNVFWPVEVEIDEITLADDEGVEVAIMIAMRGTIAVRCEDCDGIEVATGAVKIAFEPDSMVDHVRAMGQAYNKWARGCGRDEVDWNAA